MKRPKRWYQEMQAQCPVKLGKGELSCEAVSMVPSLLPLTRSHGVC